MSKVSRHQSTLARKLLILGAVPAIVMFVVLMVFFTSARLEDARKEMAASSQMLADSLAPAVEYAVVSGNVASLEQILEQSLRQSQAEWIRVLDVAGETLGIVSADGQNRVKRSDDFDLFSAEILQLPVTLEGDRESEWFQPQYGFGAGALRVGTVEVGMDKSKLASKQSDILWTSIAVGVFLLLFTMLIVNHILNGIISPIRRLSRRVMRLTDRDYEEVPVSQKGSSQEISELEERLNFLAEHLRELQATRNETLASSERARERAERANKTKSEFLATMSHELRTPLNGVLGMIELISEDPLTARQKDYLLTAKQSTEDLLMVISDILDYSQIDRGTLRLEERQFDLKKLVENCAASFRLQAKKQGLSLELTFLGEWPPTPTVVGDSGRLRQILSGLIDNAVKFTTDGDIEVKVGWFSLEADCVLFNCSVTDSGCGIPGDRVEDIFNSFEQLDSRDNRMFGGTGMGLSLVQRLVELLGGHIKVESDIGKGSSFHFELPFELPKGKLDETKELERPAQPLVPPGGRSRALVVEDNLVNQRVATALLKRLGFETDAAMNGQEAIDYIQSNHAGYDVILMDCQMPIMDGYETTRYIRDWEKSNGQGRTPIIALTADALPGTETNCRDAGMNDYLSKPVRKENLRQILSRWVQV